MIPAFHRIHGAAAAAVAAAALTAAGAPALAKGGPKADAGDVVAAYEARHGAWSVSCDPCVSYEEAVCVIWPQSDEATLQLFPADESDPKPPLGMTYFPERDLAFETEGTLTVSVDGTPVQVISAPDVYYTAMYGDLFVEPQAVAPLLPALREGERVTLEFVDADGGEPDAFPLEGFAAALEDMQQRLPFPRRPFDDTQPDSCPY